MFVILKLIFQECVMKKIPIKQLFKNSTLRIQLLTAVFVLVVAVFGFGYYFAVVSPSTARAAFSGLGNGEEHDPFQITTCEQLQSIGDSPNGYNYVFMNDIDCSDTINWDDGKGFKPISGYGWGRVNGRNYKVTDLYINRPTEYAVGLFAYPDKGAIIENFTLDKSPENADRIDINGARSVGAVAAEFRGREIYNVHSSLNVQGNGQALDTGDPNDFGMSLGGLVGLNWSTINKSSSTGNVRVADNELAGKWANIGGLVGVSSPNQEVNVSQARILSSFATGDISNSSGQYASTGSCGGLVGGVDVTSSYVTENNVSNSYSTGDVTCVRESQSPNSGGFIGSIVIASQASVTPIITNNFTVSDVSGSSRQGGFYGGIYNNSNGAVFNPDLTSNYFDATRTGSADCGDASTTCNAVNVGGSEPNYFSASNNPSLFSTWDQTEFGDWELSNPYPIHQTSVVRANPVANFSVVRDGDDFIATWERPTNVENRFVDNVNYHLFIQDVGNNGSYDNSQVVITPGSTSAIVSGLAIPGKYNFKIQAVSNDGEQNILGLFTPSLEVSSGMPASAPANLTVDPRAKSLSVEWDSVEEATSYQLQFRKVGQSEWSDGSLYGSLNGTTAVIAALENLQSYQIRVAGTNVAGAGPWSEPVTAITIPQTEYQITNCQELEDVSDDMEGIYTLANDIDCSSIANFQPIGGSDSIFVGSFDGNGKTISNLTIQRDLESDNSVFAGIGLFGAVFKADLQDITLADSTIIGGSIINESFDQDGNGLPDAPEPNLDVSNPIVFADSAVNTLFEFGFTVLGGFPRVAVGGVAGVIATENSTYSDISVLNTTVQGTVAGGAFGAVIPALTPAEIANEAANSIDQNGQLNLTDNEVVLNNIRTSGLVNGFASGGIVGLATSGIGSAFDLDNNTFTIQNSSSSSIVEGNVSGGVIAVAGSLSPAGIAFAVAELNSLGNPTGEILRDPIQTVLRNQSVIIKNTTTSGSVNSCNGYTDFRLGSLGGLVGAGVGVSIQNSSSTSDIEVCSDSTLTQLAYGGFSGGLGGALVSSNLKDSSYSGDISLVNDSNIGEDGGHDGGYDGASAYFGASGGLVGFMLTGEDDSNGDYAIDNSSSAGTMDIGGKQGLLSFSGGLTGLYLGSGTIIDSNSSQDIQTYNFKNGSYGGLSISGGLTGFSLGVDMPWLIDTGTTAPINMTSAVPTHGINIVNSEASGDVVTNKNTGGAILAVSGGMSGLIFGQSNIISSNATGNVTSNIPDDLNLLADENGFDFTAQNFGTAISGGLIGSVYGLDLPRVATSALIGTGLMADNQAVVSDGGVIIDDSYASGNVSANISGGLIGSAEMKVDIQKTYTEGNVKGQIAGGLVGQTGLISTIADIGLYYGMNFVSTAQRLDNPSGFDGFLSFIGVVLDNFNEATGPVNIDNTYTTGNVTTRAYVADIGKIFNPGQSDKDTKFRLPTVAGGLAGLYMAPGGSVTNSYSSGKITVEERPVGDDVNPNLKIADIPSFAGGIFGVNIANPQLKLSELLKIDLEKEVWDAEEYNSNVEESIMAVLNKYDTEDPDTNFDSLLQTPAVVENVFSVSELDLTDKTFTGGLSGFYISSIDILKSLIDVREQYFVEPSQEQNPEDPAYVSVTTDINPSNFTKIDNVYMDRSKISVSNCNYKENLGRTGLNYLDDSSFALPDGEGGLEQAPIPQYDELPDEEKEQVDGILDSMVADLFAGALPQQACNFINSDNSQPQYFVNNNINAPLNEWDFENTWKVRTDDYPKFVAGATTTPTDPTGPTDPTDPVNPTDPTDPSDPGSSPSGDDSSSTVVVNRTNAVTPPGDITNQEAKDQIRQQLLTVGSINPDPEQVKGLKAILGSVPPILAQSIPYSLIFLMLVLATLYSWQAMREYRELNKYHRSLSKIMATKESIDNYLAITTHYLNTPAAIMNGAVELMTSLKKISKPKADTLTSKIKKFSASVNELVVANQVSSARSTNDEMIIKHKQQNPYKTGAVWVPASIALGLIIVANALFIYADVFNDSPFRLAFELGLFTLAVFLVGLAYKYRNYLESTKQISKRQLEMESELYTKRSEFVPKATEVVDSHYEDLSIASNSLKKIDESKLFFSGLAKLEVINTNLKNLKKFSSFSTDPPLFDLTAYLNKTVAKFQAEAADKKVEIKAKIDKGILSKIQPAEVTQIVDSVIGNAVKFSKEGGKVEVLLFKRFNKIILSVNDNGIGIPQEKLATVLQPFARATDSTQFNYEGLGLGLFTDKIITDKLGGHINIKSKVGEGTDVTIELPVVRSKESLAPVLVTPTTAKQ